MKVIDTTHPLVRMFKPDEKTERVNLNKHERYILTEAYAICEKAGELQSKIDERELMDDCENNDYEWARIYLEYCLR